MERTTGGLEPSWRRRAPSCGGQIRSATKLGPGLSTRTRSHGEVRAAACCSLETIWMCTSSSSQICQKTVAFARANAHVVLALGRGHGRGD